MLDPNLPVVDFLVFYGWTNGCRKVVFGGAEIFTNIVHVVQDSGRNCRGAVGLAVITSGIP